LIGNTVKSDNDTPTNASCTLTDRDPPPETAPPPDPRTAGADDTGTAGQYAVIPIRHPKCITVERTNPTFSFAATSHAGNATAGAAAGTAPDGARGATTGPANAWAGEVNDLVKLPSTGGSLVLCTLFFDTSC
jgi:hypothetical protein